MGEPIEQNRRHAFSLEHLAPITEREVAGDQQTGALRAIDEARAKAKLQAGDFQGPCIS